MLSRALQRAGSGGHRLPPPLSFVAGREGSEIEHVLTTRLQRAIKPPTGVTGWIYMAPKCVYTRMKHNQAFTKVTKVTKVTVKLIRTKETIMAQYKVSTLT